MKFLHHQFFLFKAGLLELLLTPSLCGDQQETKEGNQPTQTPGRWTQHLQADKGQEETLSLGRLSSPLSTQHSRAGQPPGTRSASVPGVKLCPLFNTTRDTCHWCHEWSYKQALNRLVHGIWRAPGHMRLRSVHCFECFPVK